MSAHPPDGNEAGSHRGARLAALGRRHFVRTGIVYVAAAWAALQFADLVFPLLGLNDGAVQWLFWMLCIGLLLAVALSCLQVSSQHSGAFHEGFGGRSPSPRTGERLGAAPGRRRPTEGQEGEAVRGTSRATADLQARGPPGRHHDLR